jgi:hypothetical protein
MPAKRSTNERLQTLDQQLAELTATRRAILAECAAGERRLRTRQAAILGGWLMAHDPDAAKRIVQMLKRPQDRAAFGLAPLVSPLPTREFEAAGRGS